MSEEVRAEPTEEQQENTVSDIAATEVVSSNVVESTEPETSAKADTSGEDATATSQPQESTPDEDSQKPEAAAEEVKVSDPSVTDEATTERSEFPDTARAEAAATAATDVTKEETEVTEAKDATATVKFQLLPSKQVVTIASPINLTVQQLSVQLAEEIKVSTDVLQFSHDGKPLSETTTLKELDVQPNGTIRLEVTSSNPEQVPLKSSPTREQPGTSDVITVRLIKESNDYDDVVVEIERYTRKKPFLGGFRHKFTGVEYHHASAQTASKITIPTKVEKFTRDCQTVFEKNKTSQTTNTTSTQMTKIGCYVSTQHDKVIIAGKYTTYQEYFERQLKAVIVLQSYFRRWQARNVVYELKFDRDRRLKWEQDEEIKKRREKETRIKKEFERRMNPKTKEDFDLLYAALEKWRLEELGHINEELDGPERKAALCALLEQETQLIASIGRHKLEATKDSKEKTIVRFLDKAASPKRWKAYDGRYTEMDTQFTIRAKEMRDIYNSINMKYLTQDERLDVLLTLKHTVKEHDCKLTREIIELIDREADLLMRGVSETNLDGLRKRISTLFLQYCKNPLFNPEAARLLKVPQDPSTLRKDIYFCPSANQYLPSTEFKITANSRAVGKCRKVQELDNAARTRQDFSHYRIMLRNLRRTEESYGDNSKIAYLIQEKDLQYLVENVWAAQSILSAWDDLYDLVLVRWDKDEEWSPWNCILLTKDEAMSHARLDHLHEAYGQVFIHKIKNKHTLARIYFSRIPGMSEQLRKKTTGSQRLPGPGKVVGTNPLNAF
ncbi:IQ motif and ubiquitin-like domain-containing protein [Clavelina lepadiformis]|uniref:IQ motif and ubiquitin-like domain-containing protein n=1 Tax=Clavelina lepadiformis TaxID=159417 RepID=UPI00404160C8